MRKSRIQPTLNDVCTFIRDYTAANGHSPSLRDIAAGCQRSLSTIRYSLNRLEEQGRTARTPIISRSIRVLTRPQGDSLDRPDC